MARKHKLNRKLGLFLVTIYGLGNIVGAGIYALIGKVAGEAGMATPLAFLLAAFVAGFSALSFAELSIVEPPQLTNSNDNSMYFILLNFSKLL